MMRALAFPEVREALKELMEQLRRWYEPRAWNRYLR
jgi:hypothetical protein